jgi:hypothetical protein
LTRVSSKILKTLPFSSSFVKTIATRRNTMRRKTMRRETTRRKKMRRRRKMMRRKPYLQTRFSRAIPYSGLCTSCC